MLITFEGIDGAGKTTQIKLLKKWLKKQGYKVLTTSEPTKNKIGRKLREYMRRDTHDWVEAILFSADRAIHCEEEIIPALEKDKIVIVDRYTHSTLAYQVSKGLKKRWVKCLNKHAPKPELTIYLDVKPMTAMDRINKRKKRTVKYEQLATLRKVRKEYRKMKGWRFKIINGEQSKEIIHEEIKEKISKLLDKK